MFQDMMEPTSEELLIEGISSPIAVQLLDFFEDDGSAASDIFTCVDHHQSQPWLPHREDGSSSSSSSTSSSTSTSSAATTAIATNTPFYCYAGDAAPFSPFSSLYALLDAPSVPPDPESGLARYPSSSSSSQNPPPHTLPPAMFPLAPTPPYVGDPFDHILLTDTIPSGFSLDPAMVVPMPATGGPPCQQQNPQAPYGEPHYAAAMQQPQELVGLDAPPCGFLEGTLGMGAALYGGGGGEPQGFFGMAAAGGPDAALVGLGDAAEGSDLGTFGQEAIARAYSPGDLQVISGGGQHLMVGCSGNSRPPLPATDISPLEDSSYRVGRLSVEERKEKIHRYMKKRNERNFSKKIKYACRKTLADSRPRVRGRFAKNDELGELARLRSSNHEFEDEEEVAIKEEDILNTSDILAHLTGVNSFKCNYTLESWI
ncbi:hypothetical protein OPV22_003859 [Ensete ventricosum]|uniref:CCT domain-containing protein n=1 Tax=Ensete ventricosum TaxID=4639 RepID=A0AAV8S244_ENSVE|nr:hypothetical protein OPV22_003859 [Ensete ventricosum]